MSVNVENEFEKAERLARKLEKFEAVDGPADEHLIASPGAINNNETDLLATTKYLGRGMLFIAGVILCTSLGLHLYSLNQPPVIRDTGTSPKAVTELIVFPRNDGAGRLKFEFSADSKSVLSFVESGTRLQHSDSGEITALKNTQCLATRKNHFACTAQFDAPATKVAYQLKVSVENADGYTASAHSEHTLLVGAGMPKTPTSAQAPTTRTEIVQTPVPGTKVQSKAIVYITVNGKPTSNDKLAYRIRVRKNLPDKLNIGYDALLSSKHNGINYELHSPNCLINRDRYEQVIDCDVAMPANIANGTYTIRARVWEADSYPHTATSWQFPVGS